MVGKICQWARCKSNSRKPETLTGNIQFIPFIKPSQNRERCLRWIKACGRPLKELSISNIKLKHNKYICSKHFKEIINGKPSANHPDPIPVPLSHCQHSKSRSESQHVDCGMDDDDSTESEEQEEKQEMVMKLTFDDDGEGISEEIHTSLSRALRKNETQLCSNTRCVSQTNSLIQELQHALCVERRLKARIQNLHQIANINLDLLSICVDEKKNPIVKVELNKVYKLIQAVLEVHSILVNELSYSNDEGSDVDDDGFGGRGSKTRNTKRTREKRRASVPASVSIKGHRNNALGDSRVEVMKGRNNHNPISIEDSDLCDVDSILNVVNSCAFKTIEDADITSKYPVKKVDPVNSSNIIPLLDFKDIPMLNVTNLPRGLSLVNNTPVINLNTENSGTPSSPNDPSALNVNSNEAILFSSSVNNAPKLKTSNIPILNGPLLNFVNRITSPKARARLRPQKTKKRKLLVKKRVESDNDDADNDDDDDDYDYMELSTADVRSSPENIKPRITRKTTRNIAASIKPDENRTEVDRNSMKKECVQSDDDDADNDDDDHHHFIELTIADENPLENTKPQIKSRSTTMASIKPDENKTEPNGCDTKNKNNSRGSAKIVNKAKPKPLKKREDPCRGVTASRVMCDVCGKLIACSSTKSWHFQSHMRKFHTGEKPEQCEICEKRFHDSAALRSHMQYIHSQGRPHQCAVCGKSFKSRENLRKHRLVHTTEGMVYTCSVCNKKFKRSDCLKNHQRIFHKINNDVKTEQPTYKTDQSSFKAEQSTLAPASSSPSLHPLPLPPPPAPSSLSSLLNCPPPHPVPSIPHPLPAEAHAYPPSSTTYLHNPHPPHDTSLHDILWDGRAVPVPPVHMYPLPSMHSTVHMEFPPWHPPKYEP